MAHNILVCALLAMAPVVELRGALPAGLAMGIPALPLYLLCVVCNLIPVPFIIVFIRRVLGWMARRGGKLGKIAAFVELHAHKKLEIYRKYEMLGCRAPARGRVRSSRAFAICGCAMRFRSSARASLRRGSSCWPSVTASR